MSRTVLKLTVLCSFALSAMAQKLGAPGLKTCNVIPIGSTIDMPVEVRDAQFTLYSDRSVSSVSIRNHAIRPIITVLLLVDYLDDTDRHILTGVYYGQQHADPLPLRIQTGTAILRLENSILPEHGRSITFTSDLVASGCPFRGVITRVSLTFSDGTTWSSSSPRWRTDPAIREAQAVNVSTFPEKAPRVFLARLHVESDGHAVVDETDAGVEVATWLQDQVNNWTLIPAEHSPSVSDDEAIVWMVTLHTDSQIKVEGPRLSRPFKNHPGPAFMDVEIWPARQPGYAAVFVGGALASRRALNE